MAERIFDAHDPSYYRDPFGFTKLDTDYESTLQDDNYGEYIQIYGKHFDVYLCTTYNPKPVFGEDPIKSYGIEPFVAYGMFDETAETMIFGSWDKNTEQEEITIFFHKTTVKNSIKKVLVDNGIIDDEEEYSDPLIRHRLELQEGDMLRLEFNNIFYEIDGIKQEPEFQHHLAKYIYRVHARPRLVAAEDLGVMQDVTNHEQITQNNFDELKTESDKIVYCSNLPIDIEEPPLQF